jgi:hypothetical protein
MRKPQHKEPNPFYTRKYQHYPLPPVKKHAAERPQKWERIKEILVNVGLFLAGLVLGTMVGLIALSILEQWLSNGG